MKCDFCSARNVIKEYECEDFEAPEFGVPEVGLRVCSAGAWYACKMCADLIDRGDFDGLVERAVYMFLARHPFPIDMRPELTRMVHKTYERFFQHRKGIARA